MNTSSQSEEEPARVGSGVVSLGGRGLQIQRDTDGGFGTAAILPAHDIMGPVVQYSRSLSSMGRQSQSL